MPDPINNSVCHRDISWPELPADRDDFREDIVKRSDDRVSREHSTVLGAALWSDATAVSDACRRAEPGSVDEALCDDAALQKAQTWFAGIAEKALQLVLGARMGRAK